MNINLHIERLVLEDINIAPGQRQLLQASLEAELSRLLTDGGIVSSFEQGTAIPKISASAIQLTGNNPVQLGQQIAQSVYGGICHE